MTYPQRSPTTLLVKKKFELYDYFLPCLLFYSTYPFFFLLSNTLFTIKAVRHIWESWDFTEKPHFLQIVLKCVKGFE